MPRRKTAAGPPATRNVKTRSEAKDKGDTNEIPPKANKAAAKTGPKPKSNGKAKKQANGSKAQAKPNNGTASKRKAVDEPETVDEPEQEKPKSTISTAKKQKTSPAKKDKTEEPITEGKISLLENPPRSTAKEIGLSLPLKNDAKTIFSLFLAAHLSAARINHSIAFKTTQLCLAEGWGDVKELQKSTLAKRIVVLTDGGYTKYRGKAAIFLGDFADWIVEKYDGDLNNLAEKANNSLDTARQLLQEFKGCGGKGVSDTNVDIFFRDAQILWPFLCPFADKRALDAAKKMNIANNTNELWEAVGEDVQKLADVCTSLILNDLEGVDVDDEAESE